MLLLFHCLIFFAPSKKAAHCSFLSLPSLLAYYMYDFVVASLRSVPFPGSLSGSHHNDQHPVADAQNHGASLLHADPGQEGEKRST